MVVGPTESITSNKPMDVLPQSALYPCILKFFPSTTNRKEVSYNLSNLFFLNLWKPKIECLGVMVVFSLLITPIDISYNRFPFDKPTNKLNRCTFFFYTSLCKYSCLNALLYVCFVFCVWQEESRNQWYYLWHSHYIWCHFLNW